MVKSVRAFLPETQPAQFVFGDGETYYEGETQIVESAVAAGKAVCGVECSLQATRWCGKGATLNCWPDLTAVEKLAVSQETRCAESRQIAGQLIEKEIARQDTLRTPTDES